MIKLVGLAVFLTSATTAPGIQMSRACTMHGGTVVCFRVPGAAPVAGDGPCYAAEHSDQPDVIVQKMTAATSKLFKACSAFPAPQAANTGRQTPAPEIIVQSAGE